MKSYCYIQDNQGHSTTPFLLQTDCPWEVALIEWKTANMPGADRIGVSYLRFRELLLKEGFVCRLIEQLEDNSDAPPGYIEVRGATANR